MGVKLCKFFSYYVLLRFTSSEDNVVRECKHPSCVVCRWPREEGELLSTLMEYLSVILVRATHEILV